VQGWLPHEIGTGRVSGGVVFSAIEAPEDGAPGRQAIWCSGRSWTHLQASLTPPNLSCRNLSTSILHARKHRHIVRILGNTPQTLIMADAQVFEEHFIVEKINREKYDRVSRLSGKSVNDNSLTFTLDINHEVWKVEENNTIQLVLATTLALDGTTKEGAETSWRNVSKAITPTLANLYDYVCYGKNYRFEDAEAGTETV
jgi:DNA-directed RNA polymerase I, II, and III subunit RPABC3